MSNPFDLAGFVTEALDGILRATTEDGDRTEAEVASKARTAAALIVECRPSDATEVTLAAQTFMLDQVFTARSRDARKGGAEGLRHMAGFVKAARLMHRQIDWLRWGGGGWGRPCDPALEQAWRAVAAHAVSQVLARRRPAGTAAPRIAADAPKAEQTAGGMPGGEPVAATSWLDHPFDQWVIDILGPRAARPEAVPPGDGDGGVPALPHRPAGYRRG